MRHINTHIHTYLHIQHHNTPPQNHSMSDKFGFKHAFMAMAAVQALTLGLYDKLTASKLTFALGTMSVYFTLGGALVGGMRVLSGTCMCVAGPATLPIQTTPTMSIHISLSLSTYLSHSPTRGLRHVPALHLQALRRHQRRGHLLLHLHGLRARQHPRVSARSVYSIKIISNIYM